jgi:hypothetical protein
LPGPPLPAPTFAGFRLYAHGDAHPVAEFFPGEREAAGLRGLEESRERPAHRFELRGFFTGGHHEKSLEAYVAGKNVPIA